MQYRDFIILGFVLLLPLSVIRRKKYQMTIFTSLIYAAMVFIFGALGSKILFVFENLEYVSEYPEEFFGNVFSGFSFFGAVFFLPLFLMPFHKLYKLSKTQVVSAGIPLGVLMLGIMRLGCLSAGCCGGTTGVFFGREIIWPTQIMEFAGDVFILALILLAENGTKYQECLYQVFLVLYGVLRLLVEFLRDTPKDWLGMSHGQVFAIISIVLGGVLLLMRKESLIGTSKE